MHICMRPYPLRIMQPLRNHCLHNKEVNTMCILILFLPHTQYTIILQNINQSNSVILHKLITPTGYVCTTTNNQGRQTTRGGRSIGCRNNDEGQYRTLNTATTDACWLHSLARATPARRACTHATRILGC